MGHKLISMVLVSIIPKVGVLLLVNGKTNTELDNGNEVYIHQHYKEDGSQIDYINCDNEPCDLIHEYIYLEEQIETEIDYFNLIRDILFDKQRLKYFLYYYYQFIRDYLFSIYYQHKTLKHITKKQCLCILCTLTLIIYCVSSRCQLCSHTKKKNNKSNQKRASLNGRPQSKQDSKKPKFRNKPTHATSTPSSWLIDPNIESVLPSPSSDDELEEEIINDDDIISCQQDEHKTSEIRNDEEFIIPSKRLSY